MHTGDNIRFALRALRDNKLRTILTTLGVVIGVSSVVSAIGIGSKQDQIAAVKRAIRIPAPRSSRGEYALGIARMRSQCAFNSSRKDIARRVVAGDVVPDLLQVELRARR